MIKMTRETPYFKEKEKTIEVGPKKISELLDNMKDTGFQGRRLGEVVEAWEEMIKDEDIVIMMGLAGSMSTTGMWKIVRWLIENRYIDVLVSTGANISEDIYEAMGFTYWKGEPIVDDADLLKHKIDRFYDVYADELDYRKMEHLIMDFMDTLPTDYAYSSADFLYLFGKWLSEKNINSIVAAAYKNGVPVFSPALIDSGYGVAAFELYYTKKKKIILDQVKDYLQLVDIGMKAKETGVVYIGGGVPKDTINLVAATVNLVEEEILKKKELRPHRYAIQITTDAPQWGGLSGATFEEAISWGKVDAEGKKVVVYVDATIALPLVAHALYERLGNKKRKKKDLSWIYENLPEI